jgi:hypothetical protein
MDPLLDSVTESDESDDHQSKNEGVLKRWRKSKPRTLRSQELVLSSDLSTTPSEEEKDFVAISDPQKVITLLGFCYRSEKLRVLVIHNLHMAAMIAIYIDTKDFLLFEIPESEFTILLIHDFVT